ncbi:MAG TPA: hypothetical protein DGT23_22470 [Micromonosporaceae bacterium]|nr:hypothetical protein [Micromonosporaceae bacterium]
MWEETGYYGFFTEQYGWTFEQARCENPQWYLDRLPGLHSIIEEIKADAERERNEAEKRQADMNRGW